MIQEYNEGLHPGPRFRYPKTVRGTVLHAAIDEIHRTHGFDRLARTYLKFWRFEQRRKDEAPLNWRGEDRRKIIREGYEMIRGYFAQSEHREAHVVAAEAKFVVQVASKYWCVGTIDQVRQIAGGLQLLDFKSGQVGSQEELDHSYQLGLYSLALLQGRLRILQDDGTYKEMKLDQFPKSLGVIRLTDYVPLQKPMAREVQRLSEAKYYGVSIGSTIYPRTEKNPQGNSRLVKGGPRGCGYYESRFDIDEIPLLERSLSNAISMIRLNRYFFANSSACNFCPYAGAVCRAVASESGNDLINLDFNQPSPRRSHARGKSNSPPPDPERPLFQESL